MRRPKAGRLENGEGWDGKITRRHEETLGGVCMFMTLIVMMVSWVYM